MATGDKLVKLDGLKAVYDSLSGEIDNLNTISMTYESSTFEAANSISPDKRYLLNNGNPIASTIKLGELYLVANVPDIACTFTVELANLNENGTYTVYDSVTKVLSITGVADGQLIPVINIDKTTNGETYVFIWYTGIQFARFKMAAVTGKTLVVCDTTSGTTFSIRSVSGYEATYKLYLGVTSEYALNNINSLTDLQNAVGDYKYYEFFNASQASGYWNCYITKSIPSGTKVRVTMLTNSAGMTFNVRAYDASNNNQLIKAAFADVGGTAEATLTLNATTLRLQTNVTSSISNARLGVMVATDTEPGITADLFNSSIPRVYHVEKDGSGDFTNLAQAINVATQWFDSIVYVGPGTWNILDELGDDYLATASVTNQGIVLKNRVHVICSSKAYIKCLYSVADPENITTQEAAIIDHISAFNAGPYGFTLENADIEVANVRYCVHDERGSDADHYDNYYINCRMKNTNSVSGSRSQCIGGGLGYDGHVIIDGCTFENPLRNNYGVVSYHNAHGAATDSRSLIEVKGCYFKGTNTFRAGYYGNTKAMTQCLVHGNSMGAEPFVAQEDPNYSNVNMEIVAWNNTIRE